MPLKAYTKTFLPLESNPEIFTSLAHNLGLSSTLKFTEVYDLDEGVGEVLAYVLAFPTDEGYDERHDQDDGDHKGEIGIDSKEVGSKQGDEKDGVERNGDGEGVLWLRQTIHNACGLYALLHATCNGEARKYISNSPPLPFFPPPQPSPPLSITTNTKSQNQTPSSKPSSPHPPPTTHPFSPHPQISKPSTPQPPTPAIQQHQSREKK
jgi:hypothetical protein